MSDSEFEAPSVVSVAPKKKSKASSSKRKAGPEKQRDSSPPLELTRTSSDKSAQRKRKYSSPDEVITTRTRRPDLFNILRAEEASCSEPKSRGGEIISSFSSRVSTGTSRRTAKTGGEYFVDLKIYKKSDYVSHAANVRYKTALVSVKLQCDESSSSWEALQGFLRQAFTEFEESEPVHYSDKK
ncbi:uncharacterized protein LOC121735817 [Aricia agestis]|uniref:uncharacterized protein LOC121735817 n=1 Tax=Aricia agestis TaxID=91739 RepID=UPI001C20B280|nr:uncharacterized protein LOC121735817 [Aricia agestis]